MSWRFPKESDGPYPARIINPGGFSDLPMQPKAYVIRFGCIIPLVDFKLDEFCPLTYLMSDGSLAQSDRHIENSDKATSPWIISWWIPRDLFERGSYKHDSDCRNKGHWVCEAADIPPSVQAQIDACGPVYLPRGMFTFETTTRESRDAFLFWTCQLDGVPIGRARGVYAGVRIGANLGIGGRD